MCSATSGLASGCRQPVQVGGQYPQALQTIAESYDAVQSCQDCRLQLLVKLLQLAGSLHGDLRRIAQIVPGQSQITLGVEAEHRNGRSSREDDIGPVRVALPLRLQRRLGARR